jgi:2-(1,2-epoxy-1,2-dihydrophenyl)acetyl-CoA isomerase
MTQTASEVLLTERTAGGVAVLTLNRPEAMNALSGDLIDALVVGLRQVEGDREARCVVITGAGRGFCAGGDVKGMARRDSGAVGTTAPPGAEFEAYEDASRQLHSWHEQVVRRIYRFPKPVIALVNGAAAGAGLGLAGACDIRLASDRAVFTTAFARIGRSGDFGTSFFLRQLVGPAKLRELYFTSDRIDAEEALRLGLVNHVYPHDELIPRGMEFAARVAAGPMRAFARMKEAFFAADAGDLDRVLAIEAKNMPLSRGAEGRTFLQQFLERR